MAPSYKYQKGNRKPMAIKNGDYKIRCSFCGKTEDQVRKLIAGPDGSYIQTGYIFAMSVWKSAQRSLKKKLPEIGCPEVILI